MNEGDEYKLSNEENVSYFNTKILKGLQVKYDFTSSEEPKAFFTGGLPGAGKSKIVNYWENGNPNILLIDVDELREYHPNLMKITEHYGNKTSSITHTDASKWGMQIRNYALENKIPYILDSTLRNPNSAEVEINKAKENGFRVNVIMIAVNEYESLSGAYSRYLEQYKEKGEEARYVDPLLIKDSVELIIESADKVDTLNVDSFKIINRQTEVLYDNQLVGEKRAKEVMQEVTSLKSFSEERLKNLEDLFYELSYEFSKYNIPFHIQDEVNKVCEDLNREIYNLREESMNSEVEIELLKNKDDVDFWEDFSKEVASLNEEHKEDDSVWDIKIDNQDSDNKIRRNR